MPDTCAGDIEQFHRALSRACTERNLDGI